MDHTTLVHVHPTSAGGNSVGVWHQIASSPTEAARYISDHVNIPPRESYESAIVPASVLRDLTGCYPGAGQKVRWGLLVEGALVGAVLPTSRK